MIVRKIRPEELKRTRELFSIAFEYAYDCEKTAEEVYEEAKNAPASREDVCLLEKYAAFEDDDKTMFSCLSAIRYPMRFDGNTVSMAGIGGVSSLPTHRRRGGIRGCFETMLPELYKDGVTFSCLYPFSTGYYRKFGYELSAGRTLYKLALSFLPKYTGNGYTKLVDESNRDEILGDVKKIYEYWQNRYNGMIINEDWEYQAIIKAQPYKKQEFAYVYYNEANEPTGYMIFQKEKSDAGQILVCSRFVFCDLDGLLGLFGLAASFASDHTQIHFMLPESCDIEPVILEYSLGACEMLQGHAGMVRIVNVKKALELAAYRGSGSLAIEVADKQITENNGVFHVKFAEGKAVEVKCYSCGAADKDSPAAQLRMPINQLSRFLFGTKDAGVMELCADVEILDHSDETKENIEKVFYKKPCFLMEYF